MAQSFTISTARQKFFALFQTVTGHRGRKVVITSRGSEHHAVLVGESYLNELEAARSDYGILSPAGRIQQRTSS